MVIISLDVMRDITHIQAAFDVRMYVIAQILQSL